MSIERDVYVGLGNAYMTNDNFKRALELFIIAQKDLPKDLSLLKKIGVCQIKIDDVNSAIISYEQLVAMDPNDKMSYKTLAQLYDKKNDVKQAISNYKRYSATFVEDDIVTKIAMYEYDKQNYIEAVKYFKLMTEFSNQTKFAYGESLLKIKDYAKSLGTYFIIKLISKSIFTRHHQYFQTRIGTESYGQQSSGENGAERSRTSRCRTFGNKSNVSPEYQCLLYVFKYQQSVVCIWFKAQSGTYYGDGFQSRQS